jgi:hypothetical protein
MNDELVPGSFIFVPGFRDKKYQSKTKRGSLSSQGFFQEKIPGGLELSIIWGTTTRILIIFGVPPHKYKYLK